MSDQKNTPAAGFPPPEKDSSPGAFPDLSAHSDSPAWLSEDGNHDAGVWERSFEGAGDADMPAAEAVADDQGGDTGANGAGAPDANPELTVEPVVVAPEELELEEPSLADPTLGEDAVEAAALDEVASETAAVEANAAEAGRLSGLEPAPAGAEIPVGTKGSGTASPEDTVAAEDTVAPEDTVAAEDTAAPEDSAAEAEPGSETADPDADESNAEEEAENNAEDSEDANTAEAQETAEDAADAEDADTPEAPETADDADPETETAGVPAEAVEPAAEDAGSAAEAAADPVEATEAEPEKETREPVSQEPAAEPGGPGPLHGIDAAAPVTGALPDQEPRADDAAASPEPAAAAVPAGDTRRSRRLAESQAAAAAGASARKPSGPSTDDQFPGTGQTGSVTGTGTPAGSPQDPAKGAGKGKRNTRLLLVLVGVVLAAIVAILLFVFVFNDKEEGVLSEDVSPVELDAGACLQDWDDVNSAATVVTCETPHDAQLVATDSFTEDAPFPGTGALEERVDEVCAAVKYSDAATQIPGLKLTKSIPTEQTWATGDRRVDCFVFAPEGQELTESLLAE